LSSEFDVERHRATELEAELTQVRQRYDELEYRSGGVQSALVEAKRYAAELERDSVPLAALQKAFAEAVDRVNGKPKTTTKKETANV
jgi:predicted  nucleic acid-binding Zn-ribbon protein